MKISLAGPSYTSRSVVAAAQQTMNLVPEMIESPAEAVRMALYARPGLKLFKQLTGDLKIRCLWAGGGRLFCIHGQNYSEVKSDGTQVMAGMVVAQTNLAANPSWPFPDPAQIFSNGHQLMIISGGLVYCDNGVLPGSAALNPNPARYTISGTGDAHSSPKSLTNTSSPMNPFTPTINWVNTVIDINGTIYTITSVPDPNTLMLSGPGLLDQTGVTWKSPATGAQVQGYTGGFLDGYFIVQCPPNPSSSTDPGRNFTISKLNDGVWWDPLDYGVKEGAADYIHSILCDHEELYLFGTATSEVWSNVGDPNFPFARNPGAFIHEGTTAIFGCCSIGLSVCGLAGGADGQTIAFQISGLQPKRISTHAQETEWNSSGYVVSDAVSYGYSADGHTFWVLNFWQMARTWVYDLTTGLWHERANWDSANQLYTRYKPWFHAFIPEWGTNGKHIVGDPATGKLYEMSTNFTDDDGSSIFYRRAFPHLINEDQFAYLNRMEVLVEMGALGSTDPVPQITLDISKDHGHTFANPRPVTMGASGDYRKRAVWRRLGKARDSVPRISIEAKVKIALIDAYLEGTPGFA